MLENIKMALWLGDKNMQNTPSWCLHNEAAEETALTFENMDEGSTSFSTDRGIWCSQNPVRQGNDVFPVQQFRFPIINASLLFTLLSVCL